MTMDPNKVVKGNFPLALLRSLLYDLREFQQQQKKQSKIQVLTSTVYEIKPFFQGFPTGYLSFPESAIDVFFSHASPLTCAHLQPW